MVQNEGMTISKCNIYQSRVYVYSLIRCQDAVKVCDNFYILLNFALTTLYSFSLVEQFLNFESCRDTESSQHLYLIGLIFASLCLSNLSFQLLHVILA